MKKIKWLLQSTGKNLMLKNNFETVRQLNYLYNDFGVNHTSYLSGLENCLLDIEDYYIFRGGVKLVSLINQATNLNDIIKDLTDYQLTYQDILLKKIKKGIFYDIKAFDQFYYQSLNLPLLNNNAYYDTYENIKQHSFNELKFIKPTQDLKIFIPGVLEIGQTIENFVDNTTLSISKQQLNDKTILVSPLKNIKAEYRFFVINEEIITGSLYKEYEQVKYNEYIPKKVLDCAKEYAKLYQPHDIFTMDIAETDNVFKIIEYNVWNGSGLYCCNKLKLFHSVNEYMQYSL